MKRFFAPNISRTGRLLRAAFGMAMIVSGLLFSASGAWLCTALLLAGCFVLYEAIRGWCLLRACGVRTRL